MSTQWLNKTCTWLYKHFVPFIHLKVFKFITAVRFYEHRLFFVFYLSSSAFNILITMCLFSVNSVSFVPIVCLHLCLIGQGIHDIISKWSLTGHWWMCVFWGGAICVAARTSWFWLVGRPVWAVWLSDWWACRWGFLHNIGESWCWRARWKETCPDGVYVLIIRGVINVLEFLHPRN